MKNFVLVFSVFVIAIGLLISFGAGLPSSTASRTCSLTALDVGQGDAILLQTPDHQDLLVDGGPGSAVIPALDRNLPLGDNDLEMVVATHPDSDHIGGLPSVLSKYRVATIMTTGVTSDTTTDRKWREAQAAEQAAQIQARRGNTYRLGSFATLEVLWPDDTWLQQHPAADTNDTSIVLRVTCAGSTALLTGDAPSPIEDRLIDSGSSLSAAVLKVGHHGSRYSTSSRFLTAVQPEVAVISVGPNNRYGHPHATVLQRLQAKNIPIRQTDLEGDVILHSDGKGSWR